MKIGLITSVSNLNAQDSNIFAKGLPPYLDLFADKKKLNLSPRIPQLGTVILATLLKSKGFDVDVLDLSINDRLTKLRFNNSKYDLLGISSTSLNYEDVIKIAKLCRNKHPESTIITGGQVSSFHCKELIEKNIVDGVVIGEGELSFIEICKRMEQNKTLLEIPGLYTSGNYMEGEQLNNIDDLPYPDWSLLQLKYYIPSLPVQTMRGCPYSCVYCSEKNFWKKPIRVRSKESVVKEIKNNVEKYNIKTFRFVDSCFTSFPKRTKDICDMIINENLDIKWTCYARADNLTEELVRSMAESGCVAVDIGAESGSDIILKSMFKDLSVEKIKNAIKLCKDQGILVHTNFIMGFPGETKNTINETVSLIKEAKPTTYCFNPLFLFPTTELYYKREQYGINGSFSDWQHKTMNSNLVRRIIPRLFKKDLFKLKGSYYFFGGEHAANVMTALGYEKTDIEETYRSFTQLSVHKKNWAIMHILLSRLGLGKLNTFLDVAKHLRMYGA